MAPHGDSILSSTFSRTNNIVCSKPPKPNSSSSSSSSHNNQNNNNNIQRTISDISYELSKQDFDDLTTLPPITEVEDAKCECCGMSEEFTPEYIKRVRDKYLGKWVCGLCSEAVKEELEKNGGKNNIEEALSSHMSACVRFNKFGRSFPVLFQAEAMKEMLKKSKMDGRRVKSFNNPREKGGEKKGGLARSSSCIPTITRDM